MNTKNLWLRFVILTLLVACSISALKCNGLRQGIDLRGGHSLIFEIRSNEAEIRALEDQRKDVAAKLAAASEADKAPLKEKLDRIDNEINRSKKAGERGDLAERMISILKKRVDPNGLLALEWTPLGTNRIEIRMPAASAESAAGRDEYRRKLDALVEHNISRAQIRSMLQAPATQRADVIHQLAGNDAGQQQRLEQLASTQDEMAAAEKARDTVKEQLAKARGGDVEKLEKSLAEAQGKYENLQVAYEERLMAIEEANVSPQRLQAALSRYVSPAEEKAIADPKEIATRRETFTAELDAIRAAHPARVDEINTVADAYQKWSDVRRHLDDPSDLRRLIAKAGVLEFRIAPTVAGDDQYALSPEERQQYIDSLRTEGPDALRRRNDRFQWFSIKDDKKGYASLVTADYAGQKYLLLSNQPGYTMLHQTGPGGWSLARVYMTADQTNRPAVGFEFDEAGAKNFAALTGANHGRMMAILLDDEVYSAPVIRATISQSGIIEMGSADPEEVNSLIRTLEAGSLPAKLNPEPVAVSSFGPSVGEVNREMGLSAAKWALLAVAAFMLVYYLVGGAIADVALMLNVILLLGAMSMFQAVFTLPGIAGVILTMGMAVDANVLIFERLREEQHKGQPLRQAMKNAYEKAFSAIFDSNITTLITCAILGWFGTEEVRGFAITLGLGVAFSMFTALTVTRWIIQWLLDIGVLKNHLTMLRLIGVPKIDWMSKRFYFWALSNLVIIFGIVAIAMQGKDIFGIEFSSGTQAELRFRDDAMVNGKMLDDAMVRDMFTAKAGELGFHKLADTARVETRLNPNRVDDFLRDNDTDKKGDVSLQEWQAAKKNVEFFKALDANGDGVLTRDELLAKLPSFSYQVSTTETQVSTIRDAAREAFGNSLQVREKRSFDRIADKDVPELGIRVPGEGSVQLTSEVRRQLKPAYREELLDFEGGAIFVVDNVKPAISRIELVQRISEMREQPDFKDQSVSPTEVIGLKQEGEDAFSSFAIAVRPGEAGSTDRPGAFEEFAKGEWNLIKASLEREEALNVRSFDAQVAGEATGRAAFAVVFSWIAMVIYLWVRFGNWKWGLSAVITLIHDVTITVGLVAASGWLSQTKLGQLLGIQPCKIDLTMIAALLTIVGYSVNDTIVVFDRIRENRGKLAAVTPSLINDSINQTLSRTILTSGTVFIVVIIMYVIGGTGLHAFTYAFLIGVVFGTYSSIAISSPLLLGFRQMFSMKAAVAKELR